MDFAQLYLGPGGLDNKERRARVGRVKSCNINGCFISPVRVSIVNSETSYELPLDDVTPLRL